MQPQQPYGPPQQSPEPPREYPPQQPQQPVQYVPGRVQPGQQSPVLQPLPTYPSAAPTNAKPSDYEFIVNPTRPTAKASGLAGNSKLLLGVVGGLLIVLLLVGGFALFGKKGDENTRSYLSISQQQAELIRLSAIGASQTGASATLKNSALTTNMTLTTDASKFSTLLTNGGITFEPEQLTLGTDAAATKKLETAVSTNTFDTAYNEIMQVKITRYQQSLQTLYGTVTNEGTKTVLSDSYEHAKLLDKQIGEN